MIPRDSLVVDGLAVGQTSHTDLMQQLRHVCKPIVEIRLHMWAYSSDSADCVADFVFAHKKRLMRQLPPPLGGHNITRVQARLAKQASQESRQMVPEACAGCAPQHNPWTSLQPH